MGYTFSTGADQLQSNAVALFSFLPNILLSGFMFPVPRACRLLGGGWRGAAAHALSAHRAFDHAEKVRAWRSCNIKSLRSLS